MARKKSHDANGARRREAPDIWLGDERPESPDVYATPPLGRDGRGGLSPDPAILVAMLVDLSGSIAMRGADKDLIIGLGRFHELVLGDSNLERRLDFALIGFNELVTVLRPYGPIADWQPPSELACGNGTWLGTAAQKALELQGARLAELESRGRDVQRKFIFLMTDGQPCGEPREAVDAAAAAIEREEQAEDFGFYCLAVPGADLATLRRLTPRREVLGIHQADFLNFFRWLYQSMQSVAMSQPGARAALPNPTKGAGNPNGWN